MSVKGLKLRIYITRPKGEGKHAAVLFMPSPLPQPMEFPPQLSQHPYKLLIASLTKAGYVTMRVDRAAVGDSEGDDPLKTDYAMDVESFRNAIKRLGQYEFVDAGQVYLLSMGLGSALTPTVAEGSPLKGVVTYGCTVVRPWHQCIPEMMRRMWDLETVESGEIDKRAKSLEGFLKQCSKPGSKPAEVVKDFPELAAIQAGIFPSADNMLGMPLHYYQDITRQDLQATWGRVSVPVLSMWGNAPIFRQIDGTANSSSTP
ncbi:MAG: alpha/beta hydrolase [Planctomycetes bacterium]|nr:alpha/beta hydrolase [Planctomycetota bacterium]